MVKSLPARQETQVRSLGQEDPLEKGMTTHSGILAWWVTILGVATVGDTTEQLSRLKHDS